MGNKGINETKDKEYFGTYKEKIEAYVSEHKDTTAGMTVAAFDSTETIYEEGKLDLEMDIREYLPEEFVSKLKYEKQSL